MNILSRTITGIIMVIFGLFLIGLSFFTNDGIWILIYGIPILMIGLFVLFNTKEDKIESRKDVKGGKKRWVKN